MDIFGESLFCLSHPADVLSNFPTDNFNLTSKWYPIVRIENAWVLDLTDHGVLT